MKDSFKREPKGLLKELPSFRQGPLFGRLSYGAGHGPRLGAWGASAAKPLQSGPSVEV